MLVRNKNSAPESGIAALTDLIDDPTAIVNAQGVIIQTNESFERICGLTKKEFVGSSVNQLYCLTDEMKKVLLG